MGVLDISNMHFVKSPCGKIELGYCLSKSYRIPEMAIDGKGSTLSMDPARLCRHEDAEAGTARLRRQSTRPGQTRTQLRDQRDIPSRDGTRRPGRERLCVNGGSLEGKDTKPKVA